MGERRGVMIQEALFDIPTPVTKQDRKLPPEPPQPVIQVEPLGPCCKCGEPGTRMSRSGKYIYCEQCGKCGHWYIDRQARCGISIEKFVLHPRLGIWCCSCALRFESEAIDES
jgi:hypothetical protein